MPRMWLEPASSLLGRAKTVFTLDRAATVGRHGVLLCLE
jgi:hypothetical protein